MDGYVEALLSSDHIEILKNDTELGCGNFIDKLYDIHPEKDVDFIYLQIPAEVPGVAEFSSLSMETLMQARKSLAAWYLSIGIQKGEIVTVCVSDGILPFLHYVALSSIGATACIINPRMPLDMATAYIRQNQLDLVIVDDGVLVYSQAAKGFLTMQSREIKVINISDVASYKLDGIPDWWPLVPSDNTLVMLSHTSGTTGISKAVMFEHRQFFMGKRARLGRFAESCDERFLSALPQSHSSAISHLETAVLHGIQTYVLSDSTGSAVKDAISEFAPTTVAGFPQTYASLVHMGLKDNEFPSVRRWFSMGDAMHGEHIKEVLRSSPASRFIDSFGSSELGMALFRKVSTSNCITESRCVGRPVDIASCRIFDGNGDECAEGTVGLLAVRSSTITPGYWMRDDLTRDSWTKGYFITGDVGYVKNGEYYLIDRSVDVLELGGNRYYTLLLEERLQKITGVADAVIAGVDRAEDPIVCVTVVCTNNQLDKEGLLKKVIGEIRSYIKPSIDLRYAVVAFLTSDPSSVPTGATGKALKKKLRESAARALRGDAGDTLIGAMSHMAIDFSSAPRCEAV